MAKATLKRVYKTYKGEKGRDSTEMGCAIVREPKVFLFDPDTTMRIL
jgi:hypothetical protein